MTFADLSPWANHLWQSTLFASVAWLLTLALRKNRAAVRYWVWLAASVKFLIPFSLLVSAGAHLGWRTAPAVAQPQFSFVMEEIAQPFAAPAPTPLSAVAAPALNPMPAILFGVWLCGVAIGAVFWLRWWRRIRAVQRAAAPLALNLPIRVMSSPGRLEPGVFGIRKPVLLLPEGIADRLTAPQLEAILAHELRHVQRRDNLTAAIHMLVETLFWFHPLVWWIRTRLVEERELACDEGVLRLGSEPQVYAESILKVCEFYLASPVACAAGVTGGELKKRIEGIMANRLASKLSYGKKMLLAWAAILVVAGPIVFGLMNPPSGWAQPRAGEAAPVFEVASVKPNSSGGNGTQLGPEHGNFAADNATLKLLIGQAYHVPEILISGPGWLDSLRYDINAKGTGDAPDTQVMLMLRALLEDRFHLQAHRVTKETAVYLLVVANGGLKMQSADASKPTPFPQAPPGAHSVIQRARASLAELAGDLCGPAGRPVLDRTGIQGTFRLRLWYAKNPESEGPDLFSALREQLGLRLEAGREPVETLVVDHADKIPTEN